MALRTACCTAVTLAVNARFLLGNVCALHFHLSSITQCAYPSHLLSLSTHSTCAGCSCRSGSLRSTSPPSAYWK